MDFILVTELWLVLSFMVCTYLLMFIGVRNCYFHYHGLVSWFYSTFLIKIYFLIFQFFSQFDYCLFFLAAEHQDLDPSQMELLDGCAYTRGVYLNYRQFNTIISELFSDSFIRCRPFVHRFSAL